MKFLKKYYAVLTGLAVFIFYLFTLAPTIIQIDAGELTSVQVLLGIAHPTGYPLFTIVGHLFSLIPLPLSKAFQQNILAAIWCSLGVSVFVYTSKLVLDNLNSFQIVKKIQTKKTKSKQNKSKKEISSQNKELPELKKYIASILGGLVLAFDKTFWFQSTSVEVYSLQIFLFTLIILFLIKAYLYKGEEKLSFKNPWIFLAIALALGFSNHMTTLLILPGIAYLYFDKNKFNSASFKKIGLMLIVFFGLLILFYSYLPIRASQEPLINWGNPTNLEKIYRHISGKQYQVWLFSSTAAAKKQLTYFINNIPSEFSISLLIILIGLFVSYARARKFFIFSLITFLTAVLYSINYDIHDIDSYFLLAYIALGFFAVFGIIKILAVLKFKKYTYAVSTIIVALFIFTQIFVNYDEVDQSDVYAFEDYSKAVLNSVDQNSIIFSYLWDYLISPSYYVQFVENYRRDDIVIDKELLRRSWYFNQIETDHPGVLDSLQNDIKLFKEALVPFERGEKDYNSQQLEILYRRIMTGLVSTNIDKRSFYVGQELFENEMQKGQFALPQGYTLVPDLFLFKVVKGNNYVPAPDPKFKIRFPKHEDSYTKFLENFVGTMLARRAVYEIQYDKIDRARLYINKIKSDFPHYQIPKGVAEVLNK